jgi:pimeloyl-ACP methyl ester carboxylesterase
MSDEDTTATEVSVPEVKGAVMAAASVATELGDLHIECLGAGSPVVLWHSLFLDSRSWCGLPADLARTHSVLVIDGPSHGRSAPVARDFTFADCVTVAEQVLDHVGVDGPVDWVGNAWGGHVGIQLAAHRPERVRTLTTIGTPAHPLRFVERWAKVWPLVQLYRVTGANPLLLKPLSEALVGREASSAAPDLAAEVMSAFTAADRTAMFHAMRSMMLDRPDMSADMARLTVPALLVAARDDSTGWRPADAQAVADTMADATVVSAAGSGHSSPLLIDGQVVRAALSEFLAAPRTV